MGYAEILLNNEMRQLYDQGEIVLFIWKNEENWPLEYVSRNVEHILGYSVDDFIGGIAYASLIHSEDIERVGQEVTDNSQPGINAFTHKDYRVKRKDGRYIWVHDSTIIKRNGQGEIEYYIGHIHDVSEHYYLNQTSQLATIGTVSANIAHEINNPLAVVMGRLQLLEEQLSRSPLSKEQIEIQVTQIKQSVQRMSKITNSLLRLSKMRNEHICSKNSLQTILDEVLVLVDFKLRKKQVQLELIPFADISVLCNEVQVGQVLLNLIRNAIDALEMESVRKIRIEVVPREQLVDIFVQDSGRGITDEVAAHLFDRFYSTKSIDRGTGLGLAMSKEFIEQNNGTLSLVSKPGEQTCFKVSLPIAT